MKKILLVDDERIFHFLTAKIFEVSGTLCEIHSAFDGQEALTKLASGLNPDYIFVDLDMPVVNGFQFVETYKTKHPKPHASVIVLTSSISDSERKQVIALGADAYLSKPLSENDVRELIKL